MKTDLLHIQSGIQIKQVPILVVDDDEDDRTFVTEAIKLANPKYTVTTLTSGQQVMAYLESLPANDLPALLILDYNMSPVTGYEVLQAVKANTAYNAITVAIYTNSSYTKYRQECLLAGACVFLTKATTFDGIRNDVKDMLSYCL